LSCRQLSCASFFNFLLEQRFKRITLGRKLSTERKNLSIEKLFSAWNKMYMCDSLQAFRSSIMMSGTPIAAPIPIRPPPGHMRHFLMATNPTWVHLSQLYQESLAGPVVQPSPGAFYFCQNKTNAQLNTKLTPALMNVDPPTQSVVPAANGNREFRCAQCKRRFQSELTLRLHVRLHVQGSKCPICGKTFTRHWLIQGHLRTHTGEKPFKCTICSKAFADKSNLRAHIQTHSGLKPFACRRCGRGFALKSYLSKHEESACQNRVINMVSYRRIEDLLA
ncbi:Transcriptional repressor scratch 1, partial [Trichinella murrelli]